jgi:hypothetical protein
MEHFIRFSIPTVGEDLMTSIVHRDRPGAIVTGTIGRESQCGNSCGCRISGDGSNLHNGNHCQNHDSFDLITRLSACSHCKATVKGTRDPLPTEAGVSLVV